jgi:protein SCO1/2
MQKKSNSKFLIGMAVALLLPLSFYLITVELSDKKMPHLPRYYVADSIDANTHDTIYHKIADARFTNQFGKLVSINDDLKGRILVIDFIFTNCETICPQLSSNMQMLQKAFKKDSKKETTLNDVVHFISITVDPARDSFPVLRTYADKFGANPDHWWFLTGDRNAIYEFATKQLHVALQPADGGLDQLTHSEKMILVDTARHIRGYYDGTDTADVIRCANDIVILTKQKDRKKK